MRSAFPLAMGLVFVLPAANFSADPPKETTAKGKGGTPVHLVVKSAADTKQIFTFAPRPAPPPDYQFAFISGTGWYRLTVDEQGAVIQVQILRRIGVPALDVAALKTFVRWRAKPGPMRIVDLGYSVSPAYVPYRRGEASHIPRH